MFQVGMDWNPKQARLKEIISKAEFFDETKQLLAKMHAMLHTSGVYHVDETIMEAVWNGLSEKAFRIMPTVKDVTVAWNIWHITRIEDLTANIIIANTPQILDEYWLNRLNTQVRDTGNAMMDEEIIRFSNEIDMDALRQYRDAVGKRTREIIESLQPEDMKRKVTKGQTERILAEGGVLAHKDSIWLLDFWGRKNIAGIYLMPITRHQMGHINDCIKLKAKIK